MQFQIHKARGQQHYYWIIVASNGKTLATSETYYNKQDALHAINLVISGASAAKVYDYSAAA